MLCFVSVLLYIASAGSFSIGFRFYYWDYYKTIDKVPDNGAGRIENHPSYKVCELYVSKKYGSFGEEIINYRQFVDIHIIKFKQLIIKKAREYINTKLVRSMKYDDEDKPHRDPQNYGITKGTPLGIDNLLSIILYTDTTVLSSEFSSTFRRISPYETLTNTKRRNSKYWWWSKLLRETVELYGERARDMAKSPFYTGMGIVMYMPCFMIRLCSPTSTSIHLEVALKFSGEAGIILQLNVKNMLHPNYHSHIRAMDCSWISRFKEEDERCLNTYTFFVVFSLCGFCI